MLNLMKQELERKAEEISKLMQQILIKEQDQLRENFEEQKLGSELVIPVQQHIEKEAET